MKHNKKKKNTYGRPSSSSHRAGRDRLTNDHRAPRGQISRPAAETRGEGIFSGTKNGYGFVEIEGLERDIFIPAGKTAGALDGDRVAVRYHAYISGGIPRTDGVVTRILEIGRTTVIGTVLEEVFFGRGHRRAPRLIVEPSDSHFPYEILLKDADGIRAGDKVEVILPPRSEVYDGELWGTVKRNFGRARSKDANYEAILAECEIPVDFPEEALAEAERVAAEPLSAEGRIDRRGEIIFTIDGAGAKDLDDAVSLTKAEGGGWLLGVHIADVSHYVRPKTELDRAAMARGTSVYFTDKVVPMLPVALSNGACSLNANEDKYALSCVMEISPRGVLGRATITRSIIRSCVRGVYTEVNDLLAKGEASDFYEKYQAVYPTLRDMHALYLTLAEVSRARGAMELEQREAEILLDESGYPVEILPRERGDAERLIEQFMLAANESVATLLYEKQLPCVYRVHESPNREKLADFITFAHNMDLDTSDITGKEPSGRDFAHLLDEAKARGIGEAISYTLLRTMAKAHYSELCHGHFGLGIDRYCHFTSPIRRLSDLATHRLIKRTLLDGESPTAHASYARRAAMAASETELRALTAERRIDALYKTIYLSRRLGEEYPATVTSVTRFGVFAALDNTCEGLIPMTELPGVWTFDEGNMTARAQNDTLRIGDRIRVRVEEADISRGKVRFSIVDLPELSDVRKPASAKPSSPAAKKRATPSPAASQNGRNKKRSNHIRQNNQKSKKGSKK